MIDCSRCDALQRKNHGFDKPLRHPLDFKLPIVLFRCPGREVGPECWNLIQHAVHPGKLDSYLVDQAARVLASAKREVREWQATQE